MKCNLIISDFGQFKHFARARFKLYAHRYIAYARLRGFKSFNDWAYHRRGFIECWAEPGFHKFWQVWNPGIGYFTYKLFLRLGGKGLGIRRRQNQNIILTFLLNGIAHNLIVMTFMCRPSIPLPFTFLAFGAFTVLFRELGRIIDLNTWPKLIHLAINFGLVIVSFEFGFRIDDWIHAIIFH